MTDTTEMRAAQFEFDSSQNLVIGDLGKKMNFVGILLIIVGVLVLLGAVFALVGGRPGDALDGISGVVTLLIGLWTRKASSAFRQIVATGGQDISNLMAALAQLRKLYSLQYWLILIVLGVIVLALIVGLVGGLLGGGA
jgi:hypothetical protein